MTYLKKNLYIMNYGEFWEFYFSIYVLKSVWDSFTNQNCEKVSFNVWISQCSKKE